MPFRDPIYALKAEFFRTLGHPVRVRMLELLGAGERTVGSLQAELGLDSSSTSQHLAALRHQGLVDTRRQGTTVFYRVRNPKLIELLAVAREIMQAKLSETSELLAGLDESS